MPLPTISVPEYKTKLPVSGTLVTYRPYLVKEEKILLIAQESKDLKEMLDAILNLLKNCVLTKGIDFEQMNSTDIEWLFLEIRKKSKGETTQLMMHHAGEQFETCKHNQKVTIDLSKAKVITPQGYDKTIMLTDKIGVVMKEPTLSLISEMHDTNEEDSTIDVFLNRIVDFIDRIFDEDEVYSAQQCTHEELLEWMDGLSESHLKKLTEYFTNQPYLTLEHKYKCEKCGVTETVTLKGMADFFM